MPCILQIHSIQHETRHVVPCLHEWHADAELNPRFNFIRVISSKRESVVALDAEEGEVDNESEAYGETGEGCELGEMVG